MVQERGLDREMFKPIVNLATTVIKNVAGVIITKPMLVWALERYAASTKNNIDDYAVQIIVGGIENDSVKIGEGVSGLMDLILNKDKTKG